METWRPLLLIGTLFFGCLADAAIGFEEDTERLAREATRRQEAAVAYTAHCAAMLVARERYEAIPNAPEITALKEFNDRLEERIQAGEVTPETLFKEKIILLTGNPVTDNSKAAQPMPYVEVRFPHTFTGAYFPAKKGKLILDASPYDGVLTAWPGIGFEVSVAKSMFEICGTLNKGKHPSLTMSNGRKLKFLSIPVDAPLNGMGDDAPFNLGHADGVMQVFRHKHLILRVLFPNKKQFAIGRSQGGLNVFEAASRFGYLAGVVGVNSSHPSQAIVQGCVDRHESMARPENVIEAEAAGFNCCFHEKSWLAHELFTPTYRSTHLPSLVPALHLLGERDWSYPEEYIGLWKAWSEAQPELRQTAVFNGAHNLWRVPRAGDDESVFAGVLSTMTSFFEKALQRQ